jgi:2-polyprenyl-3-methyl-5-hydroxy-6-metoxy-1,4-benzoquinol methylase
MRNLIRECINPAVWEAPDRNFIGHRDILTRSLARYHWIAPMVHGKILEIGCGRGYGLEILRTQTIWQVGVDINYLYLREAFKILRTIPMVCASGSALPFSPSSFDVIVAFEVIEHIEDDLSFLREIKALIRNDALIALSTPNKMIVSGNAVKPLNRFHVREYSAVDLERLLKPLFSTVNVYGQFDQMASASSRNRWIDCIPIRLKYVLPAHIQSLLSCLFRPSLRLDECRFESHNLERAHTFIALCQD